MFRSQLLLSGIVAWISCCTAFRCLPTVSLAKKGGSTTLPHPRKESWSSHSYAHRAKNDLEIAAVIAPISFKCIASDLSLSRKNDDQDSDKKKNNGNSNKDYDQGKQQMTDRFLSPRIDDAGLPITDALLAQIVAPSLQIFWLSANHAPLPTWLAPNVGMLYNAPTQGAFLAPALIHGAGQAVCWIAGALAARGFESDAFDVSGGKGYGTVVKRIVQAGSFATGLLIVGTQVDLLFEFGRYVQPGESEVVDLRLLQAIVELINDVVFEAAVLGSWRLYRASLTSRPEGRP